MKESMVKFRAGEKYEREYLISMHMDSNSNNNRHKARILHTAVSTSAGLCYDMRRRQDALRERDNIVSISISMCGNAFRLHCFKAIECARTCITWTSWSGNLFVLVILLAHILTHTKSC